MEDVLSIIGLVILLEGALYALFPKAMRSMLVQFLQMPLEKMRGVGLGMAVVGYVLFKLAQ